MSRATRVRFPGLGVLGGLVAWAPALLVAGLARGEAPGANPASEDTPASGRELFARQWIPGDPRSHGGDGLGPVYNERSCLGCHHQGGAGGSSGGDKNIEIVTASGGGPPNNGAFYSFGMSIGAAGFQYRFASNATPSGPQNLNLADLAQIHAGFRESTSVILHRFGPDPTYRSWRETIAGRHGAIFIRSSQRNATPLFGAGLIDAIPDEAIEAAARRRFAGWPQVRGRIGRLVDGRIGRFGWKAQAATLEEFVLTALTVELGLEVPGRGQASDPRIPAIAAPGLDMNQEDCDALVAYVRSLPAPCVAAADPDKPREAQQVKSGGIVFKAIGCAACHLPRLGDVEGMYSDLLLHDMSPQLGDTSRYGAFAAAAAAPPDAVRGRKPRVRFTVDVQVQEWRTPPLWGLRDSGPYLHDGRAETVVQAIRSHGGEAAASAQRYAQVSARERSQLEAFLLSLAAPTPGER